MISKNALYRLKLKDEFVQMNDEFTLLSALYRLRHLSGRMPVFLSTLIVASMAPSILLADQLSDSVSVSGTTISWTDEGWYQVQDSSSYETVCEGGGSCTVEPGVYNVINHSTGMRLEFVTVPDQDDDSGVVSGTVSVLGNVISWPDDGWYQVQDAQSYQSMCQGGTSCEVPAGEYVVINHTSGERFGGIIVGDGDDSQLPAINRDNYLAMLIQAFEVYMGAAYDERLPTDNMSRLEYSVSSSSEDVEGSTVDYQYACSNGGTLTKSVAVGVSPVIGYGYEANDCGYQGEVINGAMSVSGYRTTSHSNLYLRDFTVDFEPEGRMSVDGGYRLYTGYYGYSPSPYDYTEYWQTEGLDYRLDYALGSLLIEKATTEVGYGYSGRVREGEDLFWNYQARMEGDFDMNPPFQTGTTVSVSTLEQLYEERLVPYVFSEGRPYDTPPLPRFESGELLLTTVDGSRLQLLADNGDGSSARITIKNAQGEESFDLPWSELDNAMILRSKEIQWPRP